MSRFRNKFSVSDAAIDLLRGLGPEEGLGILIPVFQDMGDSAFQFGHGIKTASADCLLTDDAQPALDRIQPDALVGVKCI